MPPPTGVVSGPLIATCRRGRPRACRSAATRRVAPWPSRRRAPRTTRSSFLPPKAFAHRGVEHAHAGAPDVGSGAVTFDERNDRIVGHDEASVLRGDGGSGRRRFQNAEGRHSSALGHITGAALPDLHRNCGKACGKQPRRVHAKPHQCGDLQRFAPRWCAGASCSRHATAHYTLTSMHIVIADQLPASAVDVLTRVPAGPSTPKPAARPTSSRAISPTPTRSSSAARRQVDDAADRGRAEASGDRPRRHRRRQRRRGRRHRARHPRDERAGANSVSVAEHALALMLALARAVPAADAAMKRWRVGQEAAHGRGVARQDARPRRARPDRPGSRGPRARRSAWNIVAHDPFISDARRGSARRRAARRSTTLCAQADYITLHMPATPETRHLFNAERLARCKQGCPDREHGARRADRRSGARRGDRSGPRRRRRHSTCSRSSRRPNGACASSRRSSRRRTSPRRRSKRRNRSALETAAGVRDFLLDGIIRNAVNFPAVPREEMRAAAAVPRARRAARRARRRSCRTAGPARSASATTARSSARHGELLVSAVVAGVLRPMLSSGVTVVNARDVAGERGIEIVESRSSRPRDFANLLSVKLHTSAGERWVEGTVFEPGQPAADADRRRRRRSAARRHAARRCATTISPASSARSGRSWAGTASTSRASRSAATRAAQRGVVNLDDRRDRCAAAGCCEGNQESARRRSDELTRRLRDQEVSCSAEAPDGSGRAIRQLDCIGADRFDLVAGADRVALRSP